MLLSYDGLSHVVEDPQAAYCPISLTQAPKELKPYLQSRQDLLMKNVLYKAGIKPYDPSTAPYSPDTNLTSLPSEVYLVDSGKIVGARFFVGHNLLPSTGSGIELEKAKNFNKISVMLMDSHIRISRMQPHRTIYLHYDNFEKQLDEFVQVFAFLTQFEPGMGFNGDVPALLGFSKKGTEVVDLEEAVYTSFPKLQYRYDGSIPILKLRCENPQLFYEHSR